ncbi:hypothetical protein MKY91_09935 [Alkalicoccobacillus gibsonii]|uniref:Uncharacterized protein n=1 Tax=Alkalicoccobacillus gibsonii TaxID=79881 RepID=A0ABU9VI03_9BACI
MKSFISLFFILCLNSLFFATVIMLIVAKWSVIDQLTGILVIILCFVLGLWNVIVFVDLVNARRKN